jgi:hypothetical protein
MFPAVFGPIIIIIILHQQLMENMYLITVIIMVDMAYILQLLMKKFMEIIFIVQMMLHILLHNQMKII